MHDPSVPILRTTNSLSETVPRCWRLNVVLFLIFCISQTAAVINTNETCPVLYKKGVEAYLENDFHNCVSYIEESLRLYRLYITTLSDCRIKCKKRSSESVPLIHDDIEDLYFYEKTIRNTLCLLQCRKKHKDTVFGDYNIDAETESLFESRRPYEYLHVCYFQREEYLRAASSAFTYLAAHPEDKSMLASLKYYISNYPEAKINEIVNYEAKEYVHLYTEGADAYNKKQWDKVVEKMEESLLSYMQAEEECRAQCEGPYDSGWLPDFIPSIANHFTYCLRCKRRCRRKLSSLNGEYYDDFIASHYHYLQYAYYKLGKLRHACQAVASYLMFYPEDEEMKINREYYKSLPEVSEELFFPTKDAMYYIRREQYENKLFKFIVREFGFQKSEETNL